MAFFLLVIPVFKWYRSRDHWSVKYSWMVCKPVYFTGTVSLCYSWDP